jgi:hypothetical protein
MQQTSRNPASKIPSASPQAAAMDSPSPTDKADFTNLASMCALAKLGKSPLALGPKKDSRNYAVADLHHSGVM